jgi:hypothetical protein
MQLSALREREGKNRTNRLQSVGFFHIIINFSAHAISIKGQKVGLDGACMREEATAHPRFTDKLHHLERILITFFNLDI